MKFKIIKKLKKNLLKKVGISKETFKFIKKQIVQVLLKKEILIKLKIIID